MALVTLNAASDTNIPKTLPYKTSSNLCDASFSPYLNGAEGTFILQLAESNQSPKPHISTSNQHLYLVSKKVEDNEIDVFNAEKYFNEEVGDESPIIANNCSPLSQKKDTRVELYPVKLQSRSGTPSIRSESSLNSQRALLHNVSGHHQPQKTNKANRKSFLATLGCPCSCGDKNSVDIDDPIGKNIPRRSGSTGLVHGKASKSTKDGDLVSENESRASPWMREDLHGKKLHDPRLGLSTEDNFRFPASNSKIGNNVLEVQRAKVVVLEDDTRRNSLEVFGSPIGRKGKKSISRDRSLNMLSWDAIVPQMEEIEVSANSGRNYNDTDSDASSDLFEIESFSTNPSQYLVRQASDGMSSSITQATCYAPSEASIEWSVVTASAADFSVMSDTEELRSTTTKTETLDVALNGKKTPGKEMPRKRPSILSGCNSHKAVNVVGDVHKANEKVLPGGHQKSEFLMPMTRFHAENELSRFDKRNGHFSYGGGLLTCSQPGWAAQVLHKH